MIGSLGTRARARAHTHTHRIDNSKYISDSKFQNPRNNLSVLIVRHMRSNMKL
jgi:hypothetical protein